MLQVGFRGRARGTALFFALAVATLGVAGPQAAAAGASAKAVREYWTPQRMRAAIPVGLPGTGPSESSSKRGLHHRIRHIKRPPLRAHGKVFFTVQGPPTYDYQCSGTAVRAPSKSLVITAGHCSFDQTLLSFNGNAVRQWMFVPAYSHGRSPFGKWPGHPTATPGWRGSHPTIDPLGEVTGGDLRYDVGAASVAPRNGKSLQSVVGGRPMGFNLSRHRTYHAIGYPAENPFDGQTEWGCDSTFKTSDNGEGGQPAPIGIACDMTGGSSGGGWVDGKGRLVSLTSYSLNGDDNTLYGPYFGSAIQSFYNSVKSG
jgi:V8-like Glu-specific endopeptidase